MFAKLQEMTNKHDEKYTALFPEYRNLEPREKGNKISNRMRKQRLKNTRSVTKDNLTRQQLLHDFQQFARRMQLQYMYYGTEKEQHPFYVKSNWNPPLQQSVALESYLEEVKISLAEINLTKPKNNLPPAEHEALKALKGDEQINPKKADDKILQPIAQQQKSYLKDTMDFINFIEETKLPEGALFSSQWTYEYATGRGNKCSVQSIVSTTKHLPFLSAY